MLIRGAATATSAYGKIRKSNEERAKAKRKKKVMSLAEKYSKLSLNQQSLKKDGWNYD